ncbi:retrovirus-related pol polyprotein from transposon TNT 1-94 [Tanacetum coccineum]
MMLMSHLPTVESACALLQQEESQRGVFGSSNQLGIQTTALYSKNETKEKCSICGYKCKGKSTSSNAPSKRTAAVVESGNVVFTSKQCEQLMKSLPHFNVQNLNKGGDSDEEFDHHFVAACSLECKASMFLGVQGKHVPWSARQACSLECKASMFLGVQGKGPFMSKMGFEHQTSCVDRPQQNGRVERKHRNILEIVRALRFHAHLPISYWGDCVVTATYLINRFPSVVIGNKTPYEMLMNKKPGYSNLKVFGYLAVASNPSKVNDKMAPRGVPCLFLGYPPHQKGYTLLNLLTHTRFVSRDVTFYEHIFPYSKSITQSQNVAEPVDSSVLPYTQDAAEYVTPEVEPSVLPNTHEAADFVEPAVDTSVPSPSFQPTVPVVETRRSARQHVPPTWFKDFVTPSHVPRANQVSSAPLQHTFQAFLCA